MEKSNLSFVRHTGDGVTSQFALTMQGEDIGYISTKDIRGYVDKVEVPVFINKQTPHMVNFVDVPPAGSNILLRREMPLTKTYADFERGSNFGQRQLNNSFLQQLYLTQQILDGFFPEGFYFKDDLNMGMNRIINMAAPVDKYDAVNKEVTDNLESGLNEIKSLVEKLRKEGIVPMVQPRQLGDGSRTTFDSKATFLSDSASMMVFIDGIKQAGIIDYSVISTGEVVFTEPPYNGAAVDIIFFNPINVTQPDFDDYGLVTEAVHDYADYGGI